MIVVCGVAGSGKTTVGRALSSRLGWAFRDADDLHAPDAVAAMAAGVALTDRQRDAWMDRVVALVADADQTVVACSALRRAHRDRLRRARDDVRLVWLDVPPVDVGARLDARPGHFFGSDLMADQFAVLEPPGAHEPVLRTDGTEQVASVVDDVLARLNDGGRGLG